MNHLTGKQGWIQLFSSSPPGAMLLLQPQPPPCLPSTCLCVCVFAARPLTLAAPFRSSCICQINDRWSITPPLISWLLPPPITSSPPHKQAHAPPPEHFYWQINKPQTRKKRKIHVFLFCFAFVIWSVLIEMFRGRLFIRFKIFYVTDTTGAAAQW